MITYYFAYIAIGTALCIFLQSKHPPDYYITPLQWSLAILIWPLMAIYIVVGMASTVRHIAHENGLTIWQVLRAIISRER